MTLVVNMALAGKTLMKASLLIAVSLLFFGCSKSLPQTQFSGNAMGTFWHASIVAKLNDDDKKKINSLIAEEIENIENLMSTYREQSELSRFNAVPQNQPFAISSDTATVIKMAFSVSKASNGAFDVTLGEQVTLWGFGPEIQLEHRIPKPEVIKHANTEAGYNKLILQENPYRLIKQGNFQVDLSAIAKGYAVDKVSEALHQAGYPNHLIEIGGELYASGVNKHQQPWVIGIQDPKSFLADKAIDSIKLSQHAVATSGDYRNNYQVDGHSYSHTIDPATGEPVKNNVVSVTVVSNSTALSDAYATAMMVLGEDKSFALAEQEQLAICVIVDKQTEEITANQQPLLEKKCNLLMQSYQT